MDATEDTLKIGGSFYERPGVEMETLPVGPGIPLGIETVFNDQIGIGGAYGTWGEACPNAEVPEIIAHQIGEVLPDDVRMNLDELGFAYRHHIPHLSEEEDIELEIQTGARFLGKAARACGWDPSEVEGVLIGCSAPPVPDYVERITELAGIKKNALKVSIHKACDGAAAGLNLVLNPSLADNQRLEVNLAEELRGKKVLVGGIEGLSRFLKYSHDVNAMQLFGTGAGVIGVIPGETMKLWASRSHENFDAEGMLQVKMLYPFGQVQRPDGTLTEVCTVAPNHYRIAGLMHTPRNDEPVVMAGLTGMVKLFVRTGVQVVLDTYRDYQAALARKGAHYDNFGLVIAHHANLKINKLKEKHLLREGIAVRMPWLLTEFGNISAASVMIAFLRQLPQLTPGEHFLIDGFGAGTYYDVMAVEVGG